MDGQKERQGDFVFTATETGEYRFCFNNQMSTFAEKFVDFEIAVRRLLLVPFSAKNELADLYNRSRMKNVPQYQRNKAHLQNKHLRWRNLSSSSQANSRQLQGTRNTSVLERTGISAP
jgi:emp24/gp25L/p24 family/GOLD